MVYQQPICFLWFWDAAIFGNAKLYGCTYRETLPLHSALYTLMSCPYKVVSSGKQKFEIITLVLPLCESSATMDTRILPHGCIRRIEVWSRIQLRV